MEKSQQDCQEELAALKKEFDDFVYIVSHDIKSPMRAIANIATWIEEDLSNGLTQDVTTNFELLKNRVNRLENMMNGLLELSRVERAELEFYCVNIPKMMASCFDLYRNNHVDFTLDTTIVTENFITLGAKFQKVILGLLDNAVRFNDKEQIKIRVTILESDNEFTIEITDNGPGIPEEVVPKIFSIFYTVNSKDVVNTTGAGLAISCKILKLVGGKLKYTAGISNGSIFTLNWPKNIILKN